ncbi:MAG: hypothetical protein QM691_08645 [Opitutaceae bacterium]
MIVRSLLCFAGFLVAYILFLPGLERTLMPRAAEYFDADQDYVQGNFVRGQSLLYDDLTGHDVFLGSSLSHRVAIDILTPPSVKKEFIGGGPITGIKLVAANKTTPRRVFIECNYAIARAEDKNMLSNLLDPPMGALKRRFNFLRKLNRPSTLLLLSLYAPVTGHFVSTDKTEKRRLERLAEPIMPDDLQVDEKHRRETLHALLPEFAGSVPGYAHWLAELNQEVKTLEARGVECCFYRMPFDPVVEQDPSYQKLIAMMQECFPPSRYKWLLPDPDFHYKTTDGFHLTWKSGLAYTRHLLIAMDKAWPSAER